MQYVFNMGFQQNYVLLAWSLVPDTASVLLRALRNSPRRMLSCGVLQMPAGACERPRSGIVQPAMHLQHATISVPCMSARASPESDFATLYVTQALPPRYGNQHHASTGVAQSSGMHGQPGAGASLPHASSGTLSAPSAQTAPQLPQVSY